MNTSSLQDIDPKGRSGSIILTYFGFENGVIFAGYLSVVISICTRGLHYKMI